MFLKSAATVAMIITALPAGISAQEDWTWRGSVPSGQTMEIRNLNGSVSFLPGTGSQVVVEAKKHARKSNIETVTMKVIEHAGGVTICSMYPTPENAKRENECLPGGGAVLDLRRVLHRGDENPCDGVGEAFLAGLAEPRCDRIESGQAAVGGGVEQPAQHLRVGRITATGMHCLEQPIDRRVGCARRLDDGELRTALRL